MEEYQKKISILTLKYRELQENLSISNKDKDELIIKNRALEEEVSQMNYKNECLSKKYEALQNELATKEKKKGGMFDYILGSSMKEDINELRKKYNLLEMDLELKIKENEDLHSKIFDLNFEFNEKLEKIDIKLSLITNDYELEKGNSNKLANEIHSKDKQISLISNELEELKEYLNKAKVDFKEKFENLTKTNKELIEDKRILSDVVSTINPFNEMHNVENCKKLNKKKLFIQKSCNDNYSKGNSNTNNINNKAICNEKNQQLSVFKEKRIYNWNNIYKIIEVFSFFENKFNGFMTITSLLQKHYFILKSISTKEYNLNRLISIYNKVNERFEQLTYQFSLIFTTLSDIKSHFIKQIDYLNMDNIDTSKIIENEREIMIKFNLLISMIYHSINCYLILSQFYENKLISELKIFTNSEIYDTLQDSNTNLLKSIKEIENVLNKCLNYLISFKTFAIVFHSDMNNNSSNYLSHHINISKVFLSKDVHNNIHIFNEDKLFHLNKIELTNLFFNLFKTLNKINFSEFLERIIICQINLGVSLTILSHESNEIKFDNFNSQLYEEYLNNDRDYFMNLIKLKKTLTNDIQVINYENEKYLNYEHLISLLSSFIQDSLSKEELDKINIDLNLTKDKEFSIIDLNFYNVDVLKNECFYFLKEMRSLLSFPTDKEILNFIKLPIIRNHNISKFKQEFISSELGVNYLEGLSFKSKDISTDEYIEKLQYQISSLTSKLNENEKLLKLKINEFEYLESSLIFNQNQNSNVINDGEVNSDNKDKENKIDSLTLNSIKIKPIHFPNLTLNNNDIDNIKENSLMAYQSIFSNISSLANKAYYENFNIENKGVSNINPLNQATSSSSSSINNNLNNNLSKVTTDNSEELKELKNKIIELQEKVSAERDSKEIYATQVRYELNF